METAGARAGKELVVDGHEKFDQGTEAILVKLYKESFA